MVKILLIILSGIILMTLCSTSHEKEFHLGTFPGDFQLGVTPPAHSTEGTLDEGQGPSIANNYYIPGTIKEGDSGDITDDNYNYLKEDVRRIKTLRVQQYRFSFSWSGLIPNGTGTPSHVVVKYYQTLIDELHTAGIQPFLTLDNLDLPSVIQESGGWLNPKIASWFEAFADYCFHTFGDKVKLWITLDRPWNIANRKYNITNDAPGQVRSRYSSYLAGHNLLRAHAKAYRLYQRKYKLSQNDKMNRFGDS